MSKTQILVTGANGFIGGALCVGLMCRGHSVRGATRRSFDLPKGVVNVVVGNIDDRTNWTYSLTGCDAVVHLAGLAHFNPNRHVNSLAEFRRVNVDGTLKLARQAAASGVRRFFFLSSIGVNGAETFQRPFTANDEAAPHSPYALSKYEAELGLRALAAETGLEVVIIRSPLVYGPGAPGNFGSLLRWLKLGVPLPLGAIDNQRSLVALDNLVDLILTCLTHPAAVNQIFLVSDGEDISTPELLRRMGLVLGHPAHLIPVPATFLKLVAAMVFKRTVAQRLCGSLQVDIEKTRRVLSWRPPISLEEGLKRTVGHGS